MTKRQNIAELEAEVRLLRGIISEWEGWEKAIRNPGGEFFYQSNTAPWRPNELLPARPY